MRIVAMVTAWKRPEITRACYRALSNLQLPAGWSLEVQVAGSEGAQSRRMAESFGFRYLETENRPVSRKHNRNLQAARALDWDYAWLLGSDTIVTPGFLSVYESTLAARPSWVGLLDMYVYDTRSRRFMFWPGYSDQRRQRQLGGATIGAGRMFSRETVERAEWELWKPHINRGLDWNCCLRLGGLGLDPLVLSHGDTGDELLFELRSDTQITGEGYWRGLGRAIMPLAALRTLDGSPWGRPVQVVTESSASR
jgi:hypothetical protein